jgi:hypothetical protein
MASFDNISDAVVRVHSMRFVENGAGTYTGSKTLPADALLLDVIVHCEALWTAATSASLEVGDAADADGIFTAVDLKATDLIAAESISMIQAGGQEGADLGALGGTASSGVQTKRRSLTTARVITATIASVGAGTGGRTRIDIVYSVAEPVAVTQ